jgi:hypothetical protein
MTSFDFGLSCVFFYNRFCAVLCFIVFVTQLFFSVTQASTCGAGQELDDATSNCVFCAIGKFRTSDMDSCQACPGGKFTDSIGADLCENCQATSLSTQCASIDYSLGDFIAATCTTCPAVQYVDQTLQQCVNCPANSKTSGITSEQINITNCLCNAGYYRPSTASLTEPCTACANGYYKDNDLSNELCISCTDLTQMSSTTVSTASTSWTDCQCNRGYYQTASGCVLCEAGKYKSVIGNDVTLCATCSPNSYCPYDSIEMIPCPLFSQSEEGATQLEECLCNPGFYLYDNTPGSYYYCSGCANGKYKSDIGSGPCVDCEEGKYSDQQRSTECSICSNAFGQFSSLLPRDSARSCFCLEGYEHDAGSATVSDLYFPGDMCTECQTGKYRSRDMTLAVADYDGPDYQKLCQLCAVDTYQNSVGQTACLDCPILYSSPGVQISQMSTYGNTGSSFCLCPPGYRYTYDGVSVVNFPNSCTLCSAGTYKDVPDLLECLACNAGYFSSTTGAAQCSACPPGKYSNLNEQTICIDCAAGQYNDIEAATVCQNCPDDSGHQSQGADSIDACLCNAGFGTELDSTQCLACAPGKYKDTQNNVICTSCPNDAYSSTQSDSITGCYCNAGFQASKDDQTLNQQFSISTLTISRRFLLSITAQCIQCTAGWFCGPDITQTVMETDLVIKRIGFAQCRQYSTSPVQSDDFTDCKCNAGYYLNNPAHEADMSVSCDLCSTDNTEEGFYCPANDNNIYSCGEYTATRSDIAGPAAFEPEHCVCLEGYWRNCIDDPGSDDPEHGIKHILNATGQLTGGTELCSRNTQYFTSNCFQCPADVICEQEKFMQHCPLHASSPVGSTIPTQCSCNPGYKKK